MIKKSFLICILFSFLLSYISAEKYSIVNVQYEITGKTREAELRKLLKIDESDIFEDETSLLNKIKRLEQKLQNTRQFKVIETDFSYIENSETEINEVTLVISVVDSDSLMLIPYYKYNSSDGHVIKMKLVDSNFCGTLETLDTDISLNLKPIDKSDDYEIIPGASFSFNLPFSMGKIKSTWNNDLYFAYSVTESSPKWDLNTGFTFTLPFKRTAVVLDLTQGFAKDDDYKIFNDEIYFSELAKLSFPVILEQTEKCGNLVYNPYTYFKHFWSIEGINSKDEDLYRSMYSFGHELIFGEVNWIGNFRKGFMLTFGQEAAYNFYQNEFQPALYASLKGYYAWKYAGLNTRLTAFGQFNTYRKFGSYVRGIKDKTYFNEKTGLENYYAAKETTAIILNIDVPIHILSFDFEKIGWNKLKIFNMEFQLVPFIDIALSDNRYTHRSFDPRDGFYTAGIEGIVFSDKWKSLQLTFGIGFDLSRTLLKNYIDDSWRSNDSPYEISFGIGLTY